MVDISKPTVSWVQESKNLASDASLTQKYSNSFLSALSHACLLTLPILTDSLSIMQCLFCDLGLRATGLNGISSAPKCILYWWVR